ncbi:redoxin domain-containing protein [Synechococcus sp. HB1133]|uniref:thioredoxin domain-containing protein n=1 Tax=unclassified Synechococcus TaxID=2626047 RepID=UPI00140CF1B3|nr:MULTISPECIES: thioredoxin domain-containing protein [unclassified Synechococcus]MCB4393773.1 redoxin domain-containing protein [Synechococcus sp. PH41509]MCB4421253.1 redoxin domain-containing protein [Synechococcus sp. HB1133]MCB4431396.1 redoxin domain-containing protein [Synechococcus sp. HBA1120]NHI80195.1 redoxin domain-containing protein [Synechococcus sp. HB1133]
MTRTPESSPLGTAQRWVLVLVAVALALGLVMLRGGIQSESPMEQLARRSLDPQTALSNGRPTLIEFYADWCQVCREMAPAMLELEQSSRERLDVVLVNVDNPRWQDLVDRYDVNGIPQLNLFNAEGEPRGRSLGLRSSEELQILSAALLENQPLPALPGVGSISRLPDPSSADSTLAGVSSQPTAGPRSHG